MKEKIKYNIPANGAGQKIIEERATNLAQYIIDSKDTVRGTAKKFCISNYRAIVEPIEIDLSQGIVPLVGVNECGKTTILQAILCFDYTNDKINDGRHLKNIMNLYETVDKGICTIKAYIELEKSIVSEEFNYIIRRKEDEILDIKQKLEEIVDEEGENLEERDKLLFEITTKEEAKKLINDSFANFLDTFGKSKKIMIEISRELYNDTETSIRSVYKTNMLDEKLFDESIIDNICKKFIDKCPFILYNDDFNDKPYDELIIGSENNQDWQDIYRRVFLSKDKTKENSYNLDEVFEYTENRRNTILSVTSNYLSKILTKAWKELTLKSEEIRDKREQK